MCVQRCQPQNIWVSCVESMSTMITLWNSFYKSEDSAGFLPISLSLSEEQEKWPHMSQSVTCLMSGGWCMGTKMASAETADHTQIQPRLMDDISIRSRIETHCLVADEWFGKRWPASAAVGCFYWLQFCFWVDLLTPDTFSAVWGLRRDYVSV